MAVRGVGCGAEILGRPEHVKEMRGKPRRSRERSLGLQKLGRRLLACCGQQGAGVAGVAEMGVGGGKKLPWTFGSWQGLWL